MRGERQGSRYCSPQAPFPTTECCLPQIVRPVLSQSRYKNLLPLFVSRNILLVSPETKAKEMLRVLKGVPQVNLLGESPGLLHAAGGGRGWISGTGSSAEGGGHGPSCPGHGTELRKHLDNTLSHVV